MRRGMLRANSILDADVKTGARGFSQSLMTKLVDIESTRIADNDYLVIRKAVFGLLEIVAELEARVIALEGPDVHFEWEARLADLEASPTPDAVRLGEDTGGPEAAHNHTGGVS
jgi:hypothetical protein